MGISRKATLPIIQSKTMMNTCFQVGSYVLAETDLGGARDGLHMAGAL